MPKSRLARRLLAGLALLASVHAFAQSAPPPAPAPAPPPKKEDPAKLEKVEVTGSGEVEERRNSTAAKIIVNREELLKHGDTTVIDALRRQPGITIGGSGRGSDIRMRGLGGGYTQILVNGERMPPGFSIETLSPDVIERIEIIRGATAEFSTQAIAGTINIVLRKTVSNRQREVKVNAGMEHKTGVGGLSLTMADKAGALSYTLPFNLNLVRFDSDSRSAQRGFDATGTTDLYTNENHNLGRGWNLGFAPKLLWAIAKDHSLGMDLFLNHNDFEGKSSERLTTLLGGGPLYGATRNENESVSTSARANASWTRKLTDGARFEARLGLGLNRRESENRQLAYDTAGTQLLDRHLVNDATDNSLTSTGKYNAPFMTGHAIQAGWDVSRNRRTEDRTQRDIAPAGFPAFNIDESYEARVLKLAAYAQDDWEITPRTFLYMGLRWEGIQTTSVGNVIAEVESRSSVWSPILQGLWKLPGTEKDQVRGGITRTYKAPNTFDLIPRRFFALNNTATTPDLQGNPDLKPELSWGLDIAYEHYFTGGAGLFSASAFHRRVEGVILRELVDVNGTFISRPANRGNAIVQGVELDTKVNLKKLLAWAPGTDLRANYSRNFSKVDYVSPPNNRLADQIKQSANLGFDHRFASPSVTVGGNLGYRSGGPIRSTLNLTTYSTPRRTLDAYVLWRFSPAVALRMAASNVLAQDAYRSSTYVAGGRGLEFTSLNPSYMRVQATLELKL